MIELIKGNCLIEMQKIADNSIDAIITDIPYGTTACKWDSVIPFDLMWKYLNRIIKPNGAIVLFGIQRFTSSLIMSNAKYFRHQWQWIKNKPTGAFQAKYMPMKANEDVIVFGLNKVNYYPIMVKRTEAEFKACYRKNDSKSWGNNIQGHKDNLIIRKPKDDQWYKYPTNILNIKKDDKRNGKNHPTQKPVELIEKIILHSSDEGMTVFDPFMGSATTGIACQNTNRNFIGVEMVESNFAIAKKRVEENKKELNAPNLFNSTALS